MKQISQLFICFMIFGCVKNNQILYNKKIQEVAIALNCDKFNLNGNAVEKQNVSFDTIHRMFKVEYFEKDSLFFTSFISLEGLKSKDLCFFSAEEEGMKTLTILSFKNRYVVDSNASTKIYYSTEVDKSRLTRLGINLDSTYLNNAKLQKELKKSLLYIAKHPIVSKLEVK